MSANPAATAQAAPAAPAKGKGKMLIVIVAAVVLLGGAGGAWYFLNAKKHGDAQEAAEPVEAKPAAPTYMALENMVVNLADPGGERFAQVGITLSLDSDKSADQIKSFLPSVRSNVLMLVSQRESTELLKRDGKEKLAQDIAREVNRTMGFDSEAPAKSRKKAKAKAAEEADAEAQDDEEDDPPPRRKKKTAAAGPVRGVLFSAFIVQ